MEQENLIGREVTVYDRYLFAVPVKGRIVGIAEKDGAFRVEFYDDNPGGSNVTKHNGKFFHHQQCRLEDMPQDLDNLLTACKDLHARSTDSDLRHNAGSQPDICYVCAAIVEVEKRSRK